MPASRALRIQEALTHWYILLILTILLLGFGPEGYARIMEAKFLIFAVISGGYVLAMGAIAAYRLSRRELRPLEALRRSGWVQRLGAGYLLLTWVSALCSPYFPSTLIGISRYEGALSVSMYVLSFLLVSAFGRGRRLYLWVLGAGLGLFSALCAAQFTGANPFGLYPSGLSYLDAGVKYSGSYIGTTGNADLAAAYLSMAIPIIFAAFLRLKDRRRFLLLIPLALGLYAAIRMHVLAGYLGIAAGCAAAVPLVLKKRRGLAALIIAGAGGLALIIVYFFDMSWQLPHQLHQLLHGNIDPSFGSGRIYIWQQVLERVPERLLLGHGPDTMLQAGMEFRHYSEKLGREAASRIDTAHNEYLNVLYHQGALALGAYAAMLAAAVAGLVKSSREDGSAAVIGAGIAGYCVQAMFGFSMCMTAPFFWIALGLAAAPQNRPVGMLGS